MPTNPDVLEKILNFLLWLYENTKEFKQFSLPIKAKELKCPYAKNLGSTLSQLNIIEKQRYKLKHSRGIFYEYRWIYKSPPDKNLAILINNRCKDYEAGLKEKKLKLPSDIDAVPVHIAVSKKYLIPFAANDLRYVNTIEEGIELISSLVVAAGDYNIYQLVTEVQKVSKIIIKNSTNDRKSS
jgi:hypothetical protein